MGGKSFCAAIIIGVFALGTGANSANAVTAQTKNFTANLAGTAVTVPFDNNSNASCTTVDGVTTCTALSEYANYSGRHINGIGNMAFLFTGNSVAEVSPVPGSGCLIDDTIAACTEGASMDACEYVYDGGSFVNIKNGFGNKKQSVETGNITPGGTLCIDFSSMPNNFSGTFDGTITGATGDFTGFTGSLTETVTGQNTSVDAQGHAFGWISATIAGTESTGAVTTGATK